jgi:hypothetical protein
MSTRLLLILSVGVGFLILAASVVWFFVRFA